MVVSLLLTAAWPGAVLASTPTGSELDAAERLVLSRINEERAERDLRPIRVDTRIAAVARARSTDMVAREYFAHLDPDGLEFWDHLDAAGIRWSHAGEIIALNSRSPLSDSARGAVQQWMASPGHRDQIVSRVFNYAGVGVATTGGVSYWTVMFIQGADRTAPTASLTSVSSARGSRSARVRWEGSDPRLVTLTAGLASFDLQRRRAGGTWRTVRSRVTGTSATVGGVKGVRYQFRVRARDRAGNVGRWSAARSVTIR